jgi:hypothetical protein
MDKDKKGPICISVSNRLLIGRRFARRVTSSTKVKSVVADRSPQGLTLTMQRNVLHFATTIQHAIHTNIRFATRDASSTTGLSQIMEVIGMTCICAPSQKGGVPLNALKTRLMGTFTNWASYLANSLSPRQV